MRPNRKTAVEECLTFDTNHWKRAGVLKAGVRLASSWRWTYSSGSSFTVNYEVDTFDLTCPVVRLWYAWVGTSTQPPQSADYRVRLTTTTPRFGGLRWWFVCPLAGNDRHCGRRVGKLYLPPRARYFGCRSCHRLTYRSCRESHKYDSLSRFMAGTIGCNLDTVKQAMDGIGKRKEALPSRPCRSERAGPADNGPGRPPPGPSALQSTKLPPLTHSPDGV